MAKSFTALIPRLFSSSSGTLLPYLKPPALSLLWTQSDTSPASQCSISLSSSASRTRTQWSSPSWPAAWLSWPSSGAPSQVVRHVSRQSASRTHLGPSSASFTSCTRSREAETVSSRCPMTTWCFWRTPWRPWCSLSCSTCRGWSWKSGAYRYNKPISDYLKIN